MAKSKTYEEKQKEENWYRNAGIRRQRNSEDESSTPDYGYASPSVVSYGARPTKGPSGVIQPPSSGVDWWKPLTYQGGGAAEILASSANALIPVFGGDEQANVSKWLASNFSDFSSYANIPASPVATDVAGTRAQMFSKDRAKKAIDSLETMRIASGATEEQMGAGYAFLKKAASLLDKYSGEGGISRAKFASMQAEFDNMLGGVDESYQQLGRALINPTVGGNPLMQSQNFNGRTSFGVPNAKLFT